MKIGIVGAGAMGCLYGAFLSKVETNEVFLIDVWQEHMDAVNKKGLMLEENGVFLTFDRLKGTVEPDSVGIVDLAIIFVKSTATFEAIRRSKSIFGPATVALTLQNGLGNIEVIEETIGSERVVAGTTAHGATMLEPGKIRHAGSGMTVIGEPTGLATERLLKLSLLFNEAGIKTDLSDNVVGLIWDKLLVNVGINALTGITHLENGELLYYPEIEKILELAVEEGRKVAIAKGIKLNETDPVRHTKDVCISTSKNKSSMLQDILSSRQTEIDMINGAIVREGKALRIETPVNLTLLNIMKFIQRNGKQIIGGGLIWLLNVQ